VDVTTVTDARALAAAEAAVGLLPAATPLAVGAPTDQPVELSGLAVSARFTGTAHGEIVVVVGADVAAALASSPLGALDLGQAVRPALEAAAATFGPVVVDPGAEGEPADAMRSILDAGGMLVPLTDEGEVRALVALAIEMQIGGSGGGGSPAGGVSAGSGSAADGGISAGAGGVTAGASGVSAGASDVSPGGGRHSSGPAMIGGQPVPAGFAPLTPGPRGTPVVRGGLELLHDVEMEVTAELGRTRMSVRDLLAMAPGAVIELDRVAGGPTDLLVNGRLIARGEVVVIDENFGIRITEIVP
jgi:flagellar motor switch protein FliN